MNYRPATAAFTPKDKMPSIINDFDAWFQATMNNIAFRKEIEKNMIGDRLFLAHHGFGFRIIQPPVILTGHWTA